MKKLQVKVTFTEPLLGTASANPELHSEYIASKAPDARSREEEVAAIGVEEATQKAMTVFPRLEDGTPFVWDYQWKGFFKETCTMLRRGDGFKSKKLTMHKKVIDGLLFVFPRRIPLVLPEGATVGELQRPLRAQTAQGERVALAHSELAPEGTTMEFTIQLLKDDLVQYLHEWMEYGELHGTGQWRNASYGRFETEWLD